VTGAIGYVVFRGTSAGNECTFYLTTTNSFTDTGAAGTSVCANAPNIPNALTAPTGIGATPSASGGTLAAGTYYYVVTATQADGWHGSAEIVGVDVMADWVEQYGLFDTPTTFTYHHLADILFVGGNNFLNHAWPQVGQVGIAMPYGGGGGEFITNARVDFTRLEGIWATDNNIWLTNSIIGSSCGASNAPTLGGGLCDQLAILQTGAHVDNVQFNYYGGFGPVYSTADMDVWGDIVTHAYGTAESVGATGYSVRGNVFDPKTGLTTNVTGPVPNVEGLMNIYPNDATPTTYTGFAKLLFGQVLYVMGGNANVTLENNSELVTCSGQNINLGNYPNQYLEFVASAYGIQLPAVQVCNTPAAVASSETVTYSATPTFSTRTRASVMMLTGNVTGFTLPAGLDGQEKTLTFCQNATGGYTVTAPANVRGFFTVGTTASKCSAQHFTYSAAQTAWLADSTGVTNE
jgi:hypothetical protein